MLGETSLLPTLSTTHHVGIDACSSAGSSTRLPPLYCLPVIAHQPCVSNSTPSLSSLAVETKYYPSGLVARYPISHEPQVQRKE